MVLAPGQSSTGGSLGLQRGAQVLHTTGGAVLGEEAGRAHTQFKSLLQW